MIVVCSSLLDYIDAAQEDKGTFLIDKRNYLKDCLEWIVAIADRYGCTWYHVDALTKEGHPRHPLYLKKNGTIEQFDIHTYLQQLK